MRLAQFAADEVSQSGIGRRCGAVAVDSATGRVVAIAGDGRWLNDPTSVHVDEGRPEHHALLRVIAMVAARERRARGMSDTRPLSGMEEAAVPLTAVEKQYLQMGESNFPQGYPPSSTSPTDQDGEQLGYLCADLDIYLTHEPCVMCSMAMVHSRFRACIFGRRMNGTGALCADTTDSAIGYGLCWRKELNWRVITFEYKTAEFTHEDESFHA